MSHAIPYKTTIPACRIAKDSANDSANHSANHSASETFSRMHLGYESVTIAHQPISRWRARFRDLQPGKAYQQYNKQDKHPKNATRQVSQSCHGLLARAGQKADP
jgi:hypothetical protein